MPRSRWPFLLFLLACPALAQDEKPQPVEDSFLTPCIERADSLAERGLANEALVALMPDPVDSRFGRELDLNLGALRRAMHSLGFVQDRHCLAWQTGGDDEAPRIRQRSQPGAVLFRREAGEDGDGNEVHGRSVLVLLVGETPAWGVQAGALGAALGLATRPTESTSGDPCRVRILGPTFSGSARSLAAGMTRWSRESPAASGCAGRLSFAIRSGSATSSGLPALFKEQFPADGEVAVDYLSAATDGTLLQAALLDNYAADVLKIDRPERIAFLVEPSIYGADFGQRGYLTLPFPLHITGLRGEVDRSEPESNNDPQGEVSLNLDLAEERVAPDTLPSFHPDRTSRSQHLVLAEILETISRHRVEAVVIVATDTLDKLFLAQELHEHAPDVRLMTFEGDILLAHPDHVRATRGMLVASSFPMAEPDPLSRAATGQPHLRFALDGAQGVYVATRCLVGDDCAAIDAKSVWISAVGNGSLVPVRRYLVRGADGSLPPDEHTVLMPRGWSLMFSLITLLMALALTLAIVVLVRDGALAGRVVARDLLLVRLTKEYQPDRALRIRHAFLAIIPLTAALLYSMVSGPYVHNRWSWQFWFGSLWLGVLLLTSIFLLAGLLLRTTFDLFLVSRDDLPEKPWRRRAAICRRMLEVSTPLLVSVAALAGSMGFVAWLYRELDAMRETRQLSLFLERCLAFGDGLSPLLPGLLLVAVPTSWIILSLWRYELLDLTPDPERVGGSVGDSKEDLRDSLLTLRRAMSSASTFAFHRFPVLAAVLLFGPLFYLMSYYRPGLGPLLRGIEPRAFESSVSLLFVVPLLLAVGTGVWLARGWAALRRILDGLATLRFRALSDTGPGVWLEIIRDASDPAAFSWSAIASRRDAAYEALYEDGDDCGSQALGDRLEDLPRNPGAMRGDGFGVAWLAVLDWLRERRDACSPIDGPDDRERADSDEQPEGSPPNSLEDRARAFFAWQTAYFAKRAVSQLLVMMAFATVGLVSVMLAVNSYPFEPNRLLTLYLGMLMGLGVLVSITVLLHMEKNAILSLLTGTTPDKIEWHRALFARIGLFAGLPAVSLFATGFPELRRIFFDWIEPLFKVLL